MEQGVKDVGEEGKVEQTAWAVTKDTYKNNRRECTARKVSTTTVTTNTGAGTTSVSPSRRRHSEHGQLLLEACKLLLVGRNLEGVWEWCVSVAVGVVCVCETRALSDCWKQRGAERVGMYVVSTCHGHDDTCRGL
jgi:hypothetical protein